MKIEGYAAKFNSLSENLGGFKEQIAPGAFSDTLSRDDIVLLNGHDSNQPLARVSAGSLKLREDSTGLYFRANLPSTSGGKDLHRLVTDGILKSMSFGFSISRAQDEEWQEGPDGLLIRTLKRIRLLEISPVTWPAYPSSTVTALRAATVGKRSTHSTVRHGGKVDIVRDHSPIGAGRARALKLAMEARIRSKAGDTALLLDY